MSDFDETLNEEELNIITLTDEDGTDKDFEFLDLIDLDDKEYVVLLPVESEDENADGEVNTIHSILTTDGRAIAFQSKTFAKSLEDIAEIMTDGDWNEPFSIIKISGKTKSGRDFINCALA